MAGWGSDNKYALLGAFRSVAQLVSYEVPMVLVIVAVVLMTWVHCRWPRSSPIRISHSRCSCLSPSRSTLTCAAAEAGRSPFDLLEGESEIVAGYFVEYSGMKFAMFYLAEYINLFTISAICTTLFLGGWKGPYPCHPTSGS